MKLVYISNSIIPSRTANSIHVMKMCNAFANNGHDVTLLAPDISTEKSEDDIYSYYKVGENFKVQKLKQKKLFGKSLLYGLNAAVAAKKLKPDIIYGRDLAGCFFSSMLGLPVIFESHAPVKNENSLSRKLFTSLFKNPIFVLLLKSKYLKNLVVITHSLKEHYVKEYNLSSDKVYVAPDGADSHPEGVNAVSLPGEDIIKVGYVGHLYQGKGMGIIYELAKLCQWAEFHIVGGMTKDIETWKEKCENLTNIYFHGYVPHKDTNKYIEAFDVALLPNQKNVGVHGGGDNIGQWTSPLKAFEYMSAGKAILVSDLPVLRELFVDNENALLCQHDNPKDWSNKLLKLNKNEALRNNLGKKAKEQFLKKYTWSKRAENILEQLQRTES